MNLIKFETECEDFNLIWTLRNNHP